MNRLLKLLVILILPLILSLNFGVHFNSNGSLTVTKTFIAEAAVTNTFEPSASGDDVETSDQSPFDGICDTVSTTGGFGRAKKAFNEHYVTLIRWDTSSVPDNATISSATFGPYVPFNNDPGAGTFTDLVGEWYSTTNWPIDCSNFADPIGTDAFSVDISTLLSNGGAPVRESIGLTTPSNVNLTGFTGLRVGISGTGVPGPGADVSVFWRSFDNGSNRPQLQVTYTYSLQTPTVSDVTPSPVDALQVWPLTISGSNFDDVDTNASADAQVTLTKSGETTITCTAEVVNASNNTITTNCDTTGVAIGFWNVVITNSDSSSSSLSNGLEVSSEPQGSVLTLSSWDNSNALYSALFSTENTSTTTTLSRQVTGFNLSGPQLVNDGFLASDVSNSLIEDTLGNRIGGMPPSDRLPLESFKNFDDSLTTYTTDTTDANDAGAADVSLLPSTVEVGDQALVGMNYPGRILTFNIDTVPAGADWTCDWLYSNGTSLVTASNVQDNTFCLTEPGTNTVSFNLPSDLAEQVVDGVTSYWIAMEITSVTTSVDMSNTGTQIWWETGLYYTVADILQPQTVKSYSWYLGGPSMGSPQQYYVGDSGITTPDDAALEPGSDFKIDILAYLDTSAQTNKLIVSKGASLRIRAGSDFSGANTGYVSYDINGGANVRSVTGVPSGLQHITLEYDGATYSLTVDGIGNDTVASGTAPSDNASDWVFGTNDGVVFFDYIQLEVTSGTPVLLYELEQLPDLVVRDSAGTAQNGSMSFPEPINSNLSSSIVNFHAIQEPVVGGGQPGILPEVEEPDNLEGGNTGSTLPFHSLILEFGDPIPPAFWYVGIILAIVGGLAATYMKSNLMIGLVIIGVGVLVMAAIGDEGLIGLYTAIMIGIGLIAVGVMVIRR